MNPVLLVGLPDSGKTNFLARIWIAMTQSGCTVEPHGMPEDIAYVESLVGFLLQGEFAPRSNQNEEPRPFAIDVYEKNTNRVIPLIVPDVRGELWKEAVSTTELPEDWMARLNSCRSVLLFLRAHSDQIVKPLDWVTSQRYMEHLRIAPEDANEIPTQVMLCELLRFFELSLSRTTNSLPRVAVLVTAWDLLSPEEQTKGPEEYIQQQFPMLAGRLRDITKLDVRVFGASILGGDLGDDSAFKKEYMTSDSSPHGRGYIVTTDEGEVRQSSDLTLPLAWALQSA
jgi:hypothetical protein